MTTRQLMRLFHEAVDAAGMQQTPRRFRQATSIRERSIIACVSSPLGIVPKA
jgi:hypothetical protein